MWPKWFICPMVLCRHLISWLKRLSLLLAINVYHTLRYFTFGWMGKWSAEHLNNNNITNKQQQQRRQQQPPLHIYHTNIIISSSNSSSSSESNNNNNNNGKSTHYNYCCYLVHSMYGWLIWYIAFILFIHTLAYIYRYTYVWVFFSWLLRFSLCSFFLLLSLKHTFISLVVRSLFDKLKTDVNSKFPSKKIGN